MRPTITGLARFLHSYGMGIPMFTVAKLRAFV